MNNENITKKVKELSYHSTPLKCLWASFLLFLLSSPLTNGTSIFVAFSPSPTSFISASCSESLASLCGEMRYWTNEWLESHCQMAVVEKSGWGSSALSWGSCRQERECSWYQNTRLWRLETCSFLPGEQFNVSNAVEFEYTYKFTYQKGIQEYSWQTKAMSWYNKLKCEKGNRETFI